MPSSMLFQLRAQSAVQASALKLSATDGVGVRKFGFPARISPTTVQGGEFTVTVPHDSTDLHPDAIQGLTFDDVTFAAFEARVEGLGMEIYRFLAGDPTEETIAALDAVNLCGGRKSLKILPGATEYDIVKTLADAPQDVYTRQLFFIPNAFDTAGMIGPKYLALSATLLDTDEYITSNIQFYKSYFPVYVTPEWYDNTTNTETPADFVTLKGSFKSLVTRMRNPPGGPVLVDSWLGGARINPANDVGDFGSPPLNVGNVAAQFGATNYGALGANNYISLGLAEVVSADGRTDPPYTGLEA